MPAMEVSLLSSFLVFFFFSKSVFLFRRKVSMTKTGPGKSTGLEEVEGSLIWSTGRIGV
jgi:hypothetical protein